MTEKRKVWKQEKENRNTGQWWLKALLFSVLLLLLGWGTHQVTRNVLGLSGENGSIRFYFLMLLFTVVINFWIEWNLRAEQKKKPIGNILLLIGLAFVLLVVYGDAWGNAAEGFQALGNTYLSRWNAHSGEFRAGSSRAAVMEMTIELLLLIIMSLMQLLGGAVKKRRIILVIPIGIICMGLLVMAVPKWNGLALLSFSGVLLSYLESFDRISWGRFGVLGAACLLLFGITGCFQDKAQKQILSMNKDWFDFWENKGKNIEDIFDFELSQWSVDRDVIDNTTPQYKDKEVILLTTDKQLAGSVYLRGYHCKDYVDGAWEKDTKAFAEACEAYGISEKEAAEKLLLFQHEKEDIFDNEPVTYELSYTGIKSECCYFPYGVGAEGIAGEYELLQDYLIKKKRNEKEGKAVGWQHLYHLNAEVESPYEYSAFQEWYDNYVYENYLTVPDEQKAVKRLAREISADVQFHEWGAFLNPYRNTCEEVNTSRLQVAHLVATRLKEYGTYSLELDELPAGTDAVEYFLETSQEGYCEHFASAGTLILRQLGVPARYATGYIAKTGNMKASDGKYEVSVLDSAAHAWTEVYLENYGWIPIEMTPGYSGGADTIIEPVPTATRVPDETMQQPEETEVPTTAPTQVPIEDIEQEDTSEEGNSEDKNSEEDSKEDKQDSFPFLLVMGLVLSVVLGFVGYSYLMQNKKRRRKRLNGYMRRGENRKAVKWINEALYKQLVHKGRKFNRMTDGEYLLALKSAFPDVEETCWDVYFEVVRKAVYSVEEISAEEVQKCYELYKAVQQSGK
ncbi:MAG: transglutaminase domain-containing protein [Lachnospiraceae bacterium]|nr:transglutaminase domain-containing protein [Lachnospiraceae bacterium]